ncbi:unnamed protein product [Toxocara canis]|uniref:Gal_mutarotas_2 domain-containing protein n=1 Tax=Toxocara canis TaxID=6265 RepID=A0A183U355_TOXCA|nr:unnamed protein product [Toxocara canis]
MSVNDDEIVLTKSVDPSPGNAVNPYGSDISPLTFRKRYYGATLNIRIEPLSGGLMFSDKYIQLASYFASENVYGFGENAHHAIKHDLSRYTTWAMLARDEGPNSYGLDTKNLYGVFAFYICVEYDGNAHGVLIVNSNPQVACLFLKFSERSGTEQPT